MISKLLLYFNSFPCMHHGLLSYANLYVAFVFYVFIAVKPLSMNLSCSIREGKSVPCLAELKT